MPQEYDLTEAASLAAAATGAGAPPRVAEPLTTDHLPALAAAVVQALYVDLLEGTDGHLGYMHRTLVTQQLEKYGVCKAAAPAPGAPGTSGGETR